MWLTPACRTDHNAHAGGVLHTAMCVMPHARDLASQASIRACSAAEDTAGAPSDCPGAWCPHLTVYFLVHTHITVTHHFYSLG